MEFDGGFALIQCIQAINGCILVVVTAHARWVHDRMSLRLVGFAVILHSLAINSNQGWCSKVTVM